MFRNVPTNQEEGTMKPHLKPMMVSPAELVSLAKKKVLLRLLAKRELDRRGISVSVADAQRLADSVRRHFGLHTGAQLRAWLARVGLTEKTFSGLMLSWAAVS